MIGLLMALSLVSYNIEFSILIKTDDEVFKRNVN